MVLKTIRNSYLTYFVCIVDRNTLNVWPPLYLLLFVRESIQTHVCLARSTALPLPIHYWPIPLLPLGPFRRDVFTQNPIRDFLSLSVLFLVRFVYLLGLSSVSSDGSSFTIVWVSVGFHFDSTTTPYSSVRSRYWCNSENKSQSPFG